MFASIVSWRDIMLSVGSILVVIGLVFLVKKYMGKYKRPNGKKKGLTSINVALAFSVITVIAMTTRDWFVTGLAIILAYIVGRNKIDSGEYYMYQVIIGAIIGIGIPFGIFYYYDKKFSKIGGDMELSKEKEHNSEEIKEEEEIESDSEELKLEEK